MFSGRRFLGVLVLAWLASTLVFATPKASAANPLIINFQGKVVNSDGTNVTNGSYNFDFILYSDATLGAPSDGVYDRWHELNKSVTVTNGVFQTNLGSATSLSSLDFNAYSNLYLAVRFNADAAGYMTPRVQMSSVPYAFNADRVGGIAASGLVQLSPGSPQTGFINISGNITSGGTYNTNTFTSSALAFGNASTATIQSAASQALNITGHAASTFSTDAGSLTLQGFAGATVKSANAATGGTSAVSITSGDATTSGSTGAINITSGTATSGNSGTITIDAGAASGTVGSILIGTTRAQPITLGYTSGGAIRVGQNGSTVQIDGTNFDVSTGGVITLAGGQTPDITTAAATTATSIAVQPGTSSAASGTGASLSLRGGDASGTTNVTAGGVTIQAGSTTGGAGTRNGGSVTIDAGTGGSAATNGAVSLGTTNATGVSIGKAAGTLTMLGAMSLNLNTNNAASINTGTSSGTITLGGGSAPLAIDSTNFDVTTAGVVSGITGLTMASGNFLQNGTGSFGTGSGAVSLNGATSVTGTNTFNVAGGLTTLSAGLTANGATNINSTGTAGTNIGNSTGITSVTGRLSVAASAVPTADQVTITNVGQPVATAGVSGLQINYVGGAGAIEASGARIDFTPGGTSGSTWNGLRIVANATGAVSGVNEYGLKLEGPSTPGAGNETAIDITTGWDIGIDISSGGLQLGNQAEPATPAASNLKIYARSIAGRMLLRQKGPSGIATPLQPSFFQNSISMCSPNGTTLATTITEYGTDCVGSNNGTGAVTAINDETFGSMYNYASATTTGNDIGMSTTTTQWFRGSTAGANGFFWNMRIGTVDTTNLRIFAGLTNQTLTTVLGADNPAGHMAAFQFSPTTRGDTAWMFTTKDNTTQNVGTTSMTYAANKVYDLYIFVPPHPNNGTLYWRIENMTDDTVQEGSTTNNLPGGSTGMRSAFGIETRTTAARNIRWARMYVEADR